MFGDGVDPKGVVAEYVHTYLTMPHNQKPPAWGSIVCLYLDPRSCSLILFLFSWAE